MPLPFLMIDAFASRPFAGNPAAVVRLDRDLPDAVLQTIAMEFNQAETAFVLPRVDSRFDLRWFTPVREVPLCGHATLATAHAILAEWRLAATDQPVRFVTRYSGELTCRSTGDGIAMDFPATPPTPAPLPADAAGVLGIDGPLECAGATAMNLTLIVPTADHVRAAKPDLPRLAAWHPIGVTITAAGDEDGVDFVSRSFGPAAGIDEDAVTGSAHCTLAVIWSQRLGRTRFNARQLSRRGGSLKVALDGGRAVLTGQAVTTMRGELIATFD